MEKYLKSIDEARLAVAKLSLYEQADRITTSGHSHGGFRPLLKYLTVLPNRVSMWGENGGPLKRQLKGAEN